MIKAKDPLKYKELEELVREYEIYADSGKHNNYEVKITSNLVQAISEYEPLHGILILFLVKKKKSKFVAIKSSKNVAEKNANRIFSNKKDKKKAKVDSFLKLLSSKKESQSKPVLTGSINPNFINSNLIKSVNINQSENK